MKATVYTAGKRVKSAGRCLAAAVIEVEGREPIEACLAARYDESPTAAHLRAAHLGLTLAMNLGADEIELETPSLKVARITNGEGGHVDDYHASRLAGWMIFMASVAKVTARQTSIIDRLAAILKRNSAGDPFAERLFS